MSYLPKRKAEDGAGPVLGGIAGVVAGAVGAVWAGYDVGTAINNAIDLEGTIGRVAVDGAMMLVFAGPALAIGFYGGMFAGLAIGGMYNGIKNLREQHAAVGRLNRDLSGRSTGIGDRIRRGDDLYPHLTGGPDAPRDYEHLTDDYPPRR